MVERGNGPCALDRTVDQGPGGEPTSTNGTVDAAVRALLHAIGTEGAFSGQEGAANAITAPGPEAMRISRADLRRVEAKYRALVERIPAITFLAPMDQGEQELYISPQIEAILGFSQKEWLDNPILWYTQLHPDDRDRWQQEFALTVSSGSPFRSEYRFLAKDGRVVWVRGEAQMIRDENGIPLFLQGIAFDITDQKEAEATLQRSRRQLEQEVEQRTRELAETNRALQAEIDERKRMEGALRDREARLHSIVESVVDGIVVIDLSGVVEAFNPAAERIFGYRAEEVLGRNVNILMPEDQREAHDRALTRLVQSGSSSVIGIGRDVVGLRRDGSEFPMELAVSETPMTMGRRFTGIVRDVTERKRTEDALVAAKLAAEAGSRLKSEFLANMSHEIRTPLNGILGMTQLALATKLNHEQREYLEVMKSSADSLMTVIGDILDFSKIEAGKLEVEPIEFGLRDTLFDAMKPLAVRAHEKHLELICQVDDDVEEFVIGDPGRLRQIVLNLVGNSLKFTHKGEVTVHARRAPADVEGDDGVRRIQFSIRDTGIGISPEKRRLIFEPFTQADGSTTRKYGGTGLGLAISRKLVELMGGRIWVDGAPEGGSIFHFTACLPPSRTAAVSSAPADMAELKDLRVLIADDNAVSGRLLEQTVARWGMRATLVDSGPSALAAQVQARAEGRPFDLLILDALLPALDPAAPDLRIGTELDGSEALVLTLPSSAQLSETAALTGKRPYARVIKPVRETDLLASIRVALGRAPALPGQTSDPSVRSTTHPVRTLRILLVEDYAINQMVAVRLLEREGHQVSVADDGLQALELLDESEFDLVLMDVQMPVMDGFEATSAIRRREERIGGHVPIVALTANAMKGDRQRCLDAGFDDYLPKPLQAQQLSEVITRFGRNSIPTDHAPQAGAAGDSLISFQELVRSFGDDPELLQEVAATFCEDAPLMVEQIAEALCRADTRTAQRVAHKLRGGASNFTSAEALVPIQRFEQLAASADLTGALEALPGLQHYCRRLLDRLARLPDPEPA